MPTPDRFVEAYDAWKRATDQHQDMMREVMNGGMLDMEAMEEKLAEIDILHEDWMKLAGQFASVRAPHGTQHKA
jgi:hypothetical protein